MNRLHPRFKSSFPRVILSEVRGVEQVSQCKTWRYLKCVEVIVWKENKCHCFFFELGITDMSDFINFTVYGYLTLSRLTFPIIITVRGYLSLSLLTSPASKHSPLSLISSRQSLFSPTRSLKCFIRSNMSTFSYLLFVFPSTRLSPSPPRPLK